MGLARRRCWIFDLDGTLTVAVHDFDAIRAELGLPQGRPILEELAALPAARARPLYRQLGEIELELARAARPAAGAERLLATLSRRGARLGILTRNSEENAVETLRAAGLEGFFTREFLVGRETAAPKPSPAGVQKLLAGWSAAADDAVMIGDYLYDLQAGRAAGTATVYVDTTGRFPFAEHADLAVEGLEELLDP